MASYYLAGYTPPEGVTSRESVKDYQKRLGVTQDGVWGPKTQAAYEKSGGASAPQSFGDYYTLALSYVRPRTMSVPAFSVEDIRKELQSYLRPVVDLGIERRREAAREADAELTADAFSRGMGQSTYISSMKEREEDDVERDVAAMEAQYGAQLAEKLYQAMEAYNERLFEAQKYNAQAQSSAENAALGLASEFYGARETGQASTTSKKKTAREPALSFTEVYELMGYLSAEERKSLFAGEGAYWKQIRAEIQASVSGDTFQALRGEFGG